MATVDELVIRITANINNAQENINRVRADLKEFGTSQISMVSDLKRNWLEYAATVGIVSLAIKGAVQAAGDQEAANVKTAALLKQQGIAWEETGGTITSVFKDIEAKTSYSDDNIQAAFNRMIAAGVDYRTALEQLRTVANLTYSGAFPNMTSAAEAVAKAIQGDSQALSREIPLIKQLSEEQRTWGNVLAILNTTLPDATTRTHSFYGAMDNLNNKVGELQEEIGYRLIPEIESLTTTMSEFLASGGAQKISATVKLLIDDFKVMFDSLSAGINAAVSGIITFTGYCEYLGKYLGGDLAGAQAILNQRLAESEEYWNRATKSAESATSAFMDMTKQLHILNGEYKDIQKEGEKPITLPVPITLPSGRPARGQSLMDMYQEAHITPFSREGIRPARPEEMGPVDWGTTSLPVNQSVPQHSPPAIYQNQSNQGASKSDETASDIKSLAKDIREIASRPQRLDVRVSVNKIETYEEPAKVAQSLGEFLAAGYEQARYRPGSTG